jgi:hypothetical protein
VIGIRHELGGHLQNVVWQCCTEKYRTEKYRLCCTRKVTIYIVYLNLETLVEELVCFIKDKHFDITGVEGVDVGHKSEERAKSMKMICKLCTM